MKLIIDSAVIRFFKASESEIEEVARRFELKLFQFAPYLDRIELQPHPSKENPTGVTARFILAGGLGMLGFIAEFPKDPATCVDRGLVACTATIINDRTRAIRESLTALMELQSKIGLCCPRCGHVMQNPHGFLKCPNCGQSGGPAS